MEMMKAASSLVPKKFRSVRDKNGHRRNRSSESGGKVRPLTVDSWLSIFRPDSAKQAQKEKEEEEKEAAKVRTAETARDVAFDTNADADADPPQVDLIVKRLEELNYNAISRELIRVALRSHFAAGDTDKAVELLQLQQQAFSGIIQPYDPNVKMLGAENRGNVTCYLDSLLFAMFAHMTAFESMLKNDLETEPQRKLAALLRLWVNMLRSGKLIHTDMTELIQQALAECGWKEAAYLEQQDTSEAFAFIADVLQLPLLALQMDLFHQGKGDVDDHKVVHERCLNLPVPPDTDGKGIKLEDCMEAYFNNRVDVLRDSLDDKTPIDRPPLSPKSTIRIVHEEDDVAESPRGSDDNPTHIHRRWTTHGVISHSPTTSSHSDSPLSGSRTRSTSIIQRIVVNDKQTGEASADAETRSLIERVKRTGSSVVKAVTIPAWQFYRLIPWNATSNSAPKSDVELAQHFDQRPVVAICLKRYTMTDKGVPVRQNTFIDIPDSLRLPHFMVVDEENDQDPNGLSQGYKLVLQSVICHRGDSIHSGHYVAYARVAPKLLTDNRRHDRDPPPDYEEPTWVKFDDLVVDKRVEPVDDIQECLRRREEMPYVLIYQIVPMVDVTTTSTDGSLTEPPCYAESTANIPGTPSIEAVSDAGQLSKSPSGYFGSAATLTTNGGPQIRLSSDVERPPRSSFGDEPSYVGTHADSSRRTSIVFSEPPNHHAPSTAPSSEALSPAVSPQEESTGARLSRAAAMFKGSSSKSRPTSQVGENRISLTISRFGFGRQSKDSGSNNGGGANSEVSANETGASTEVGDEHSHHNGAGKENDKDHHHHSISGNSSSGSNNSGHHHHKKEKEKDKDKSRGRSKTRNDKEDKKDKAAKGKGKGRDVGKNGGVPDRECLVM
ncbi:hypothetical protein VTJ49DRAFT_4605 [Mycothermus thermophilus]|uniref:ubiquitinyl hydrolase 1 n=1 Tax=Humicola insolens TaxID=85995 RepID=A0ABR3V554_HUMIN